MLHSTRCDALPHARSLQQQPLQAPAPPAPTPLQHRPCVAITVAGCSSARWASRSGRTGATTTVSPTGSARPTATMTGNLTLDEMQADAERFFALLDTNHDGEIDPDEITHYENVIAPEISSESALRDDLHMEAMPARARRAARRSRRPSPKRRATGGGAGFCRGGDDQHQGAGRYGLLDLPEPVVSADTDFNRGVSRAGIPASGRTALPCARSSTTRAISHFADLETIRPAPPAAPKARRTSPKMRR